MLDRKVNKYSTSIAVARLFSEVVVEFALVHFHTCSTLLPTLDIGWFFVFCFFFANGMDIKWDLWDHGFYVTKP